jgi:hypothetical protein
MCIGIEQCGPLSRGDHVSPETTCTCTCTSIVKYGNNRKGETYPQNSIVKLDDLRLEGLRPRLLGKGRLLHMTMLELSGNFFN